MNQKKNTKFFSLYNSFSETEKKEFREFIKCSLYNKGRDYGKFLESLKLDNIRRPELSFTFKDRTRWNRLSELTLLAEKFLVSKNVFKDEFRFDSLLLDELSARNLDHIFTNLISQKEIIYKKNSLSTGNLREFYELNGKLLEHQSSNEKSREYLKTFPESEKIFVPLIILDILEKLISSRKLNIAKSSYTDSVTEEILGSISFDKFIKLLKNKFPEYYPLIAFNYFIYSSLKDPSNMTNYKLAKKMFGMIQNKVSKDCKIRMYGNLINAVVVLRNSGFHDAEAEMFNIIKSKIKEGFIEEIKDGVFINNYFRDYIIIACSLNKTLWAERFIDKYSGYLPSRFRTQVSALSRALIFHYKGNHKLCREYCENLNTKNPFLFVDKTKLILISSYELGDLERCYSVLKNFNEYLRRPKIVQKQLIFYAKEFCRGFTLLLKLKEKPNRKNLINIEYFLSLGNAGNKRWISEKVRGIKVR